ncbi:hypothetical protein chiPu_0023893 [Chiloscyllium punctatum]|uniref:Uncharacterized protein n=1 Tax=Chiloscyllium punctatum TaxID=137246 RepID=A0A401T9X8_CHIPU|nr:hypothetical protein [Chiloscyllium punctatum]
MWGLSSVRTRRAGRDLSKWLFCQLFYDNGSLWIPNDAITGHITNGRRAVGRYILGTPRTRKQAEQWYTVFIQPMATLGSKAASLCSSCRSHSCYLYYNRDDNDIYQHAFYQHLEGTQWDISSSYILIGKEGVADVFELTAEQLEWYEMSEEAIPHLTLAMHAKYQTKDLGPMSKRLMVLSDWVWTQLPGLQYSPLEEAYRIMYRTTDKVLLEHRQIERFHGREKTDHPQAAAMLDTLPDTL